MKFNMESIRKFLLTVLVLLVAVQVFAQNSAITGVIKDSEGKPIVGATIQENGVTNSTITDPEGKFTLQSHEGKSIIVKMKGYYTQEVKLENGINEIGEIVLIEIHRWEFGVLAGSNNLISEHKQLHDVYMNDYWINSEGGRYKSEYFHLESNVGAYIFFYPGKGTARIQTLMGLGMSLFSKQISFPGIVSDNGRFDYSDVSIYWYKSKGVEHWYCDYTLKQNINTLDISFLIKHKVRVKKSGICLLYGPVYDVIINDKYKLKLGDYLESFFEGDNYLTNNDLSKSKNGITEVELKRNINQVYSYQYVLGGMGAIGFEHSSGIGIWGTYNVKWYRNQYDQWLFRNSTIGGVLSYRF